MRLRLSSNLLAILGGDFGSIVLGLLAFGAPIIDRYSGPPAQVQFPKDDSPHFRDGKPWPEAINGANRDAAGKATGTETGFTIVADIRHHHNQHRPLSQHEDQMGSIEPGQVADIILLQGSPLENIYPMLNTKMVITR